MQPDKRIRIIDETLREGMQYRGVMFSLDQRKKILRFQDRLGVDICQAGYPGAHPLEKNIVSDLCDFAKKNGLRTRVAAMGRATDGDAGLMLETGVRDLHFHVHIKQKASGPALENELHRFIKTVGAARQQALDSVISIALLDIGRSDRHLLETCVSFLDHPDIDILSLPDTSGIMAPNEIFNIISHLTSKIKKTAIAVHCHNDMGMASANTLMGITAGGQVLEASALGIGERNGIADLYTTARHLKNQGFSMALDTSDTGTFEDYYTYVDHIVFEQTGQHLLTVNTPMFGDAVKTHVAGTHAGGDYGILPDASQEKIFLNVLCGKHLVKKFLNRHQMDCDDGLIEVLTRRIKSESVRKNRSLSKEDVTQLIASL